MSSSLVGKPVLFAHGETPASRDGAIRFLFARGDAPAMDGSPRPTRRHTPVSTPDAGFEAAGHLALCGPVVPLAGPPAPAGPEIIAALLITVALATLAAAVVFRWSEQRARERGLIDQTSGS